MRCWTCDFGCSGCLGLCGNSCMSCENKCDYNCAINCMEGPGFQFAMIDDDVKKGL